MVVDVLYATRKQPKPQWRDQCSFKHHTEECRWVYTQFVLAFFLQERHSTLILAKESVAGLALHLVVFPAFLFTNPVSLRASDIKLEWLSHSVSWEPEPCVCRGSDWLDGAGDWLLAAPVPGCCFQLAIMELCKFHAYKGVQPWIVFHLEDLPGWGPWQLVLVNYSQSCGRVIKEHWLFFSDSHFHSFTLIQCLDIETKQGLGFPYTRRSNNHILQNKCLKICSVKF